MGNTALNHCKNWQGLPARQNKRTKKQVKTVHWQQWKRLLDAAIRLEEEGGVPLQMKGPRNWLKHRLKPRFPREILITSDTQMTPPLWQKMKN